MKRAKRTVLVLLSLLVLASGCSSERHQDLLDQGYKKVGYQAYVKEKPDSSGFETYAKGPIGESSVISYFKKKVNILKKQLKLIEPSDGEKADQIVREIDSIEYMLESLTSAYRIR